MRYPGAGSKSTKPMKKHFVWITAAAVTGVASMALINPVSEKNLPDASPRNESEAENRLARAGFMVTGTSFNYLFACILASMATGLPEEFFTGLPLREVLKLKNAVNDSGFFE